MACTFEQTVVDQLSKELRKEINQSVLSEVWSLQRRGGQEIPIQTVILSVSRLVLKKRK